MSGDMWEFKLLTTRMGAAGRLEPQSSSNEADERASDQLAAAEKAKHRCLNYSFIGARKCLV
jgi:hypothetical protein